MELISRVKALLRRSAYVEEKKFLTLGNVFMDDEKHAVYVSDQVCELTYKEYELLKLLMSNAEIVTCVEIRSWSVSGALILRVNRELGYAYQDFA